MNDRVFSFDVLQLIDDGPGYLKLVGRSIMGTIQLGYKFTRIERRMSWREEESGEIVIKGKILSDEEIDPITVIGIQIIGRERKFVDAGVGCVLKVKIDKDIDFGFTDDNLVSLVSKNWVSEY
jgi:hypothetical protein